MWITRRPRPLWTKVHMAGSLRSPATQEEPRTEGAEFTEECQAGPDAGRAYSLVKEQTGTGARGSGAGPAQSEGPPYIPAVLRFCGAGAHHCGADPSSLHGKSRICF